MKVFVVVIDDTSDGYSEFEVVGVYDTLDKAKDVLKEKSKKAEENFRKDYDSSLLEIDRRKRNFLIYPRGEYIEFHYSIVIEERILE